MEVKFDIVSVLKEFVNKSSFVLFEETTRVLAPRELRLLDYVWRKYYRPDKLTGRWYDMYHIALTILFLIQLRERRPEIPVSVIAAGIGHDIGYSACNLVNDLRLEDSDIRMAHMREGAALFTEILEQVGGLSPNEFRGIIGNIATHDNDYLEIPTQDTNQRVLREADQAFIMNPVSFWKDWVIHREELSPEGLFLSRLTSFYLPGDAVFQKWGQITKITREDEIL